MKARALVLLLALAACGHESTERAAAPGAIATASTPSPATTAAVPPAVGLRPLPHEGLVLGQRRGVTFLTVDGRAIDRVAGFRLAGNPGASGVWLERRKSYYLLDLGRHRLVPTSRARAQRHMYDEGAAPKRAPPPGTKVRGRIAGHWRYARTGRGGTVLAQWSGECEVPTAFWISPGGTASIVTGESDLSAAPQSEALGWSDDGRALVFVGESECSVSGGPGIYAYTAPGQGALVVHLGPDASVDMWGGGG